MNSASSGMRLRSAKRLTLSKHACSAIHAPSYPRKSLVPQHEHERDGCMGSEAPVALSGQQAIHHDACRLEESLEARVHRQWRNRALFRFGALLLSVCYCYWPLWPVRSDNLRCGPLMQCGITQPVLGIKVNCEGLQSCRRFTDLAGLCRAQRSPVLAASIRVCVPPNL